MVRVGRGRRAVPASSLFVETQLHGSTTGGLARRHSPGAFFFLEDSAKCQLLSIDLPVASKPQK